MNGILIAPLLGLAIGSVLARSIGFAVSTDTFIAGFGFGVYGVPILAAAAVVAAVTMLMSFAGHRLSTAATARLNIRADRLTATALSVLGLAIATKLI